MSGIELGTCSTFSKHFLEMFRKKKKKLYLVTFLRNPLPQDVPEGTIGEQLNLQILNQRLQPTFTFHLKTKWTKNKGLNIEKGLWIGVIFASLISLFTVLLNTRCPLFCDSVFISYDRFLNYSTEKVFIRGLVILKIMETKVYWFVMYRSMQPYF